ncbi:hypothetical protein [Neobacillus sp. B4I6]|uniref:hypothetical protein n=1 Tax=Neobacillus sp. B4I6 TaxID=3373925 RepID=UPI003D1E8220
MRLDARTRLNEQGIQTLYLVFGVINGEYHIFCVFNFLWFYPSVKNNLTSIFTC